MRQNCEHVMRSEYIFRELLVTPVVEQAKGVREISTLTDLCRAWIKDKEGQKFTLRMRTVVGVESTARAQALGR